MFLMRYRSLAEENEKEMVLARSTVELLVEKKTKDFLRREKDFLYEIKNLKKSNEKMRKMLNDTSLTKRILELEKENSKLKVDCESFVKELDYYKKRSSKSIIENDQNKLESSKLVKEYQSNILLLKSEIGGWKSKCGDLENELGILNKIQKNTDIQLQNLQNEKDNYQRKFQESNYAIKQLKKSQIHKEQSDLKKKQQEDLKLRNYIKKLETDLAREKIITEDIEKDIELEKEILIKEHEKRISKLKNELKFVKNKLVNFEEMYDKCQRDVKNITTKYKNEVADLSEELKARENRLKPLKLIGENKHQPNSSFTEKEI